MLPELEDVEDFLFTLYAYQLFPEVLELELMDCVEENVSYPFRELQMIFSGSEELANGSKINRDFGQFP